MYSIPEKLYLIRGELKWNVVGTTPSTWHGEPVIRVSYRSSSGVKSWNYSPVDVEELPYLRSETGQFRFRDQRGLFSIACRIHRYGRGNAVCAESKTGFLSFGFADELCIETSLLDSPFRSVFDYLHSLSGISRIDDGSGNIVSLKERYESVRHVFSSSILYRYCHPEGSPVKRSSGRDSQPLIFPFGCNESQFHAVSNAFSGNSVSVIQGPPGTGKTQTILNIIANLLIREKTCLVVSNNNEEAFRQLKDMLLHHVYDSASPKDSVAVVARTLLQGLFGIQSNVRQRRCVLHPGIPDSWNEAVVRTPELDYTFRRVGSGDLYFEVTQHYSRPLLLTLRLNIGQGRFQDIQGTTERYQTFRVKAPQRLPDVRVVP